MAEHDPFDWYFRHNPFSLDGFLWCGSSGQSVVFAFFSGTLVSK